MTISSMAYRQQAVDYDVRVTADGRRKVCVYGCGQAVVLVLRRGVLTGAEVYCLQSV